MRTVRGPPPGRTGGFRTSHLLLVLAGCLALAVFSLTITLPRQKATLADEFWARSANGGGAGSGCDCTAGHPSGAGGAPLYCRLGLPPTDDAAAAGSAGSLTGSAAAQAEGSGRLPGEQEAASTQQQQQQASAATQQQQQQQHRLAVLIPYRDREQQLMELLRVLRPYLDGHQRAHDVFVVEQADGFLFNRGALLNAAALLLAGSVYDYYVFQDVDTVPLEKGGIQYSFPRGKAPLHLTPNWVHPKSTFEDFFGGILIVTAEQFQRINGFGTNFWGWGREDDNLRERLVAAGMWPPEYPEVSRTVTMLSKRSYFSHQKHPQAAELREVEEGGAVTYVQENPRLPYRGARIVSSQPQFLKDFSTGLNTTMFQVLSMQPFLNATKIAVRLYCNVTATPWCQPASIKQRSVQPIKHAAAVHAVSGS